MAAAGFLIALAGFLSYFIMLGAFHRFTYRTWIFDSIVLLGAAAGVLARYEGDRSWLSWGAIVVSGLWFIVSRAELIIPGSKALMIRAGDRLPAMTFLKTDGTRFTDQDLIADAPALLSLYRGWWCPSSKLQLDEIIGQYEHLSSRGVKIYAASVDRPEDSKDLQEHVGDRITILCNLSPEVLDRIGVHDERGAPWIEQLTSKTPRQSIAMPTALLINQEGKITYISRSTRVDDRPRVEDILANAPQTGSA